MVFLPHLILPSNVVKKMWKLPKFFSQCKFSSNWRKFMTCLVVLDEFPWTNTHIFIERKRLIQFSPTMKNWAKQLTITINIWPICLMNNFFSLTCFNCDNRGNNIVIMLTHRRSIKDRIKCSLHCLCKWNYTRNIGII